MTVQQLIVWSNIVPQLLAAKIMTRDQIAPLLKSFHPDIPDDDITALVNLIAKEQK